MQLIYDLVCLKLLASLLKWLNASWNTALERHTRLPNQVQFNPESMGGAWISRDWNGIRLPDYLADVEFASHQFQRQNLLFNHSANY
jgi:hypothetical protein